MSTVITNVTVLIDTGKDYTVEVVTGLPGDDGVDGVDGLSPTLVNGTNISIVESPVGTFTINNTLADATNPSNINQDSTHRFVSDLEKSTWSGKQDALGYTPENAANKQTTLSASANEYPNADAVLAAIAAIPIGRQASFFISSKASLIPSYGMFSATPYGITETEFSAVCTEINTEYLIKAFATNGNLAATHIPAGMWSFHTNVRVSGAGGVTNLVYRVYKRTHAGVETELFSVVSAEIDNTTNEVVETDYVIPTAISKNLEDTIIVKVFAKSTSTADRTVYILTDGTAHASHVDTTLGYGFDPDADYNPSGNWNYTGLLQKKGINVAVVAAADTNSVINFATPKIYNSVASPSAIDITDDLTGAIIGVIQKIYHSHSVAPTFPAGWVKLGTASYTVSTLNIIYCEWVSGNRVEYWISK